ncbi:antibiotic biosynthesis monooxygenase [Streptomyces fimicarius]|uniref:antibiotic biosynthesis monooxygenase n=1 Tax=Streptomyces griseus TaxID=1911 RepID=UPI0035E32211
MTRFSDLVRPAAGTALISEWHTGTAERSLTAADAVMEEWAAARTPAGRLAQHVFLSTDGRRLLFYAQWTSDEDHLAWARAHRTGTVGRIDTLVPGIERPGLVRTRLAGSVVHDAERPAGLFVVTTTAAEAAEAAVTPAPGLLAVHIHLTSDGEQAKVVAEWTDIAAHKAAAREKADCRRYTLLRAYDDDRC